MPTSDQLVERMHNLPIKPIRTIDIFNAAYHI